MCKLCGFDNCDCPSNSGSDYHVEAHAPNCDCEKCGDLADHPLLKDSACGHALYHNDGCMCSDCQNKEAVSGSVTSAVAAPVKAVVNTVATVTEPVKDVATAVAEPVKAVIASAGEGLNKAADAVLGPEKAEHFGGSGCRIRMMLIFIMLTLMILIAHRMR